LRRIASRRKCPARRAVADSILQNVAGGKMKETGPLPLEFDEALSQRVNITRELDL
jgi:hypothetical protein